MKPDERYQVPIVEPPEGLDSEQYRRWLSNLPADVMYDNGSFEWQRYAEEERAKYRAERQERDEKKRERRERRNRWIEGRVFSFFGDFFGAVLVTLFVHYPMFTGLLVGIGIGFLIWGL
jgi:hypothetical protein